MTQRLETGSVDIILCADPQLDDSQWLRQEAYREDFLLVTSRNIALPRSIEDLRKIASRHPLVCYNTESSDQLRVNRFLSAKEITAGKRMIVSSSYSAIGVISQCSGFGILPATNIWCDRQFLFDVNVSKLPGNDPFYRSMWTVEKGREKSPQLDLVLTQAREVLQEYMIDELKRVNLHLEDHIQIP